MKRKLYEIRRSIMVLGAATRKRSRSQKNKKITSSKNVNRTAATKTQNIQTTTATSSQRTPTMHSRRSLSTLILTKVRRGKSKLRCPKCRTRKLIIDASTASPHPRWSASLNWDCAYCYSPCGRVSGKRLHVSSTYRPLPRLRRCCNRRWCRRPSSRDGA